MNAYIKYLQSVKRLSGVLVYNEIFVYLSTHMEVRNVEIYG